MNPKLPFVWKNPKLYTGIGKLKALKAYLTNFMPADNQGTFHRLERHRDGSVSSVMLTFPGSGFYRSGQTCRSDIKWMIKEVMGINGRLRIPNGGYYTILFTDEPKLYKPAHMDSILRGSFEEADLLWEWVKYVTSQSWYAQKQGKIRKMFDGIEDAIDRLVKLREHLIESG